MGKLTLILILAVFQAGLVEAHAAAPAAKIIQIKVPSGCASEKFSYSVIGTNLLSGNFQCAVGCGGAPVKVARKANENYAIRCEVSKLPSDGRTCKVGVKKYGIWATPSGKIKVCKVAPLSVTEPSEPNQTGDKQTQKQTGKEPESGKKSTKKPTKKSSQASKKPIKQIKRKPSQLTFEQPKDPPQAPKATSSPTPEQPKVTLRGYNPKEISRLGSGSPTLANPSFATKKTKSDPPKTQSQGETQGGIFGRALREAKQQPVIASSEKKNTNIGTKNTQVAENKKSPPGGGNSAPVISSQSLSTGPTQALSVPKNQSFEIASNTLQPTAKNPSASIGGSPARIIESKPGKQLGKGASLDGQQSTVLHLTQPTTLSAKNTQVTGLPCQGLAGCEEAAPADDQKTRITEEEMRENARRDRDSPTQDTAGLITDLPATQGPGFKRPDPGETYKNFKPEVGDAPPGAGGPRPGSSGIPGVDDPGVDPGGLGGGPRAPGGGGGINIAMKRPDAPGGLSLTGNLPGAPGSDSSSSTQGVTPFRQYSGRSFVDSRATAGQGFGLANAYDKLIESGFDGKDDGQVSQSARSKAVNILGGGVLRATLTGIDAAGEGLSAMGLGGAVDAVGEAVGALLGATKAGAGVVWEGLGGDYVDQYAEAVGDAIGDIVVALFTGGTDVDENGGTDGSGDTNVEDGPSNDDSNVTTPNPDQVDPENAEEIAAAVAGVKKQTTPQSGICYGLNCDQRPPGEGGVNPGSGFGKDASKPFGYGQVDYGEGYVNPEDRPSSSGPIDTPGRPGNPDAQ